MSIIFPAATSKSRRFNLSDDDLQFLYKYLSMYPSESTSPRYNEKEFHSCYKKYLFYGAHKMAIPKDSIRIFNIVGQSFGYLSDCAYFCDFENKIEFFLSASIYVNSNGVLNDGKYEYEDVGFPFLENLGKTIYELELKRKKEFVPNLVNFNFEYGF